jgi:hypothetical protein
MPTWFDAAQQDVVTKATGATVPTLADTSAGAAISQFGPTGTNPFTQAQGTLNEIASGAANPWLVSSTGQVTPDTSTAMGGLFQAQNQALQQLMPQYTAPVQGGNIAAGQFGSLRGETAVNKAMADAQSKLFSDQMQAALQAQGIGTQAASALGQVGSQGVETMTKLGQAEQSDPLFASSALSKILGSMQIPTTTKNVTNLSPLNQIGSIVSAMGGSISGTDKLLKELFPAQGKPGDPGYKPAQGIMDFLKNAGVKIGGSTGGGGDVYVPGTGGGGTYIPNPDPNLDNRDVGGGGGNTGGGDTGGGTIDWDADQGGGNIDFDWGGGGGVIDTGTGEDWGME